MRMDGSWFLDALPDSLSGSLMVLTMPRKDGTGPSENYIGGTSMGFYLTRKAWNNASRREDAVGLLAALTSPESLRSLENRQISGALQTSVQNMEKSGRMLKPLQDAMNREAREVWLLECIPEIAEGRMSAEACWERVMALYPFGE